MNDKARQADNLEQELATLPEKYKGKSITDVVKMHQEAETALSRQGQELGEYRKLALTLSETATRTPIEKPEEKRPEVTTDDLFADPTKAIEDVVDSHPVVKKARETAENLERQLALNEFEKKHPSFRNELQNPEFVEWVKGNPSLVRLAQRGDQYDFDAADQLFTLWGEKKSVKSNAEKLAKELVEKQQRERDGTLEGNSGADASNEKVYSRAEIRELHRRYLLGDKTAKAKWEDPKFRAERLKAYASGRVQ